MILTLTFPDASTADLEKIAEELEAAGIELASQAPADLQLPAWHDISVALGSSGLVTAFYHIVQTWLNRNAGQEPSKAPTWAPLPKKILISPNQNTPDSSLMYGGLNVHLYGELNVH